MIGEVRGRIGKKKEKEKECSRYIAQEKHKDGLKEKKSEKEREG